MPTLPILPFDPAIAGVDEAGRGPLAGPVVVAAVLLPAGFDVTGINDSKMLTRPKREALYERITAGALYHVEIVDHEHIDRINILRATLWGMSECLNRLKPTQALVDGNQLPPNLPCLCKTLVKGDSLDAAIAAASILAKVTRDRLMIAYAEQYNLYGFEHNYGYAGSFHINAIREHGPCPIHRRSFDPLRSMLAQPSLLDV